MSGVNERMDLKLFGRDSVKLFSKNPNLFAHGT